MPVVVSVLIFIFYYIINVSGEKMAKTGDWDSTFGVWLSSMVLAPIGAFLAYKSNKDSTMFNIEGYTLPIKKLWKQIKRFSILEFIKGLFKKKDKKATPLGEAESQETNNEIIDNQQDI